MIWYVPVKPSLLLNISKVSSMTARTFQPVIKNGITDW